MRKVPSRRSRLAAGYLCGVATLLLGAVPVRGQNLDPLAALETQRRYWREAETAASDQRFEDAAECVARILSLPHLVPLPFTAAPPREALEERGRDWVRAAQRSRAAARRQAAALHWGEPCDLCGATGSVLCSRCSGSGERVEGQGARARRSECPPLDRCARCKGCGRQGDPPIAATLRALYDLVIELEAKTADDVPTLLSVLTTRAAGLDTRGLAPVYGVAAELRAELPSLPRASGSLPGRVRGSLKKLWSAAEPTTRRTFLRESALELAVVRDAFAHLSSPIPESGGPVAAVELWALVLEPRAHRDRFVDVTAVLVDPPSPGEFPLPNGVLGLEGCPVDLLMPYIVSLDERRRLEAAQRARLSESLAPFLRSYPTKSVEDQLSARSKGTRVVLRGRLVTFVGQTPEMGFEVWGVRSEDGR